MFSKEEINKIKAKAALRLPLNRKEFAYAALFLEFNIKDLKKEG